MGSAASNKAFLAIESMVSQFTKANKTVYIVLPNPSGADFLPRSMIPRSLTDLSFQIRVPDISSAALKSHLRPVVTRLREIAAKTGAVTIDPIASLCNDSICPVLTSDGDPIYRDDNLSLIHI